MRKKKKLFFIIFWFEKTKSFAYVSVRDQNHVVWGKQAE